MFKKWLSPLLVTLVFYLPLQIEAGGVCLYEISSADTRLASAGWSARADDPSTVFTNPAGMTRLCGKQVEMGAQAIFGHVHFDHDSDTSIKGEDGAGNIWLPSGSFFAVHPYNENLTFGLGSLGYFGSDLVYEHNWVGRYYVQKILCEGLSIVPAAAYKINEQWSIGAGANIMYGFLKQRAAIHNILDIRGDGYFNFHDYRFGYGGVVGVLYEYSCNTRFGLQYLTPVNLDFRATPKFHNIGPVLDAFLRDVGIIGSSLKLHVKVPQSVMLSAYHAFNPFWAFLCNVGWQQWSRFQRVTVSFNDLNNRTLSSKNKYQDTWHAAIGLEWYYSPSLTFSGGIAYDSSAVSDSQRQVDFPVGKQWRFGTGARWQISDCLALDFSSALLWQGNLKCDVSKPVAGDVSGSFKNTYSVFINTNLIYLF